MYETPDEIDELDRLIERSFAHAGSHLTSIIRPQRRLSAADLVAYLVGVRHLAVATVTAGGEPRTSGADGLFLHAKWWFTSSASSLKAHHLERRPACSVTHLRGDDIGIFAHGTVRVLHGVTPETDAMAPIWRGIFESVPEDWTERPEDARYFELTATAMFGYAHSRKRFDALVSGSA